MPVLIKNLIEGRREGPKNQTKLSIFSMKNLF